MPIIKFKIPGSVRTTSPAFPQSTRLVSHNLLNVAGRIREEKYYYSHCVAFFLLPLSIMEIVSELGDEKKIYTVTGARVNDLMLQTDHFVRSPLSYLRHNKKSP